MPDPRPRLSLRTSFGARFGQTPPVPDALGFDPAVTGIQVNPTGVMNAGGGGSNPSFDLLMRIRVE